MRNPLFALIVSGLVLCAFLVLPVGVTANQLPPPPDKTPIALPTEAPIVAPTQEPTEEPVVEPTVAPTEEATKAPVVEPTTAPPQEATAEPIVQPTSEPPQPVSDDPPAESALAASRPDPNCQAVVEGTVTDAGGRPVVGAEVTLTGEGLERKILTGDAGNYGFGGLCAGTVTLVAALPGGQVSPSATVELDRGSTFVVNLGFGSKALDEVAATEESATESLQPSAAQEPSMPATGFQGIFLLAGAILAILLMIAAGVLRTVGIH